MKKKLFLSMIDALKNKTIILAGGAGYLGESLSNLILSNGANLCIADIDTKKTENVFKKLSSKFPKANLITSHLNMSDEISISQVVDKCYDYFGNVNGLVNATFGSTAKKLEDLTAQDFNNANTINLTGSFLLARSAAKKMTEGGSIVMFGSMYGVVSPNPFLYPDGINSNPIEYGAGKAGLIQMMRYLASHYGPQNIRVNAIAPGPFPNLNKIDNKNSDFLNNLREATMLRRLGQANETAGPTVFLLSEFSSYITGHVLNVDGGWTSW
tara:strand:+ start:108 stop:914 length:807 start_codon:yes stop_codon:yes gene_type:complete